jgi:hypothetical protein
MFIKLKVDKNNLSKMIKGEEFHADFGDNNIGNLAEIYVYPDDIKEVAKNCVIVREKEH